MRSYINYIIKLKFLLAFIAAFYKAFIESNICRSFLGASLVLFNLDTVLLTLEVVVCTLLLPAEQPT